MILLSRRDQRRAANGNVQQAVWKLAGLVYHCFDRIVISGYLMGLQRPGQVVYWLQQVLGIEAITKEVLSRRTEQYVRWVQAFARHRKIPLEWAEKDVRKEDYAQPYLRRMERRNQFGVYFIFQTMEQGWTFRPGADW